MDLQTAVRALASRCDGAATRDAYGYNRYDAPLGHKLAALENWSAWQARAAWRMLAKYREQLAALGIDYAAIPEPAQPEGDSVVRKTIALDGKSFRVAFAYDASLVARVKNLPQRRYVGATKSWVVPATLSNAEPVIKFAVENDFEIEEPVIEKIEQLAVSHSSAVEASRAEDAEIVIDGLGGELRPFQRAGVAYALAKKRTFIADEMGLGKTVQALATIHAAQAYPALILCPASLKLNWEREANKWLPGKTISILNGKNTDSAFGADLLILNYDNLKKNLDRLLALNLKAVIADESHYLKNYKAQRTEAAKALCAKREYRLFLTGTPLLNRPQELLSQLGAMGRIEEMGGFWNFAKRYCNAYQDRWGWNMSGAAHLDELNEKLRAACYVRRNKADVLIELPAKQRAVVPVEIDNRTEYQRAERELIAWLRDRAAEDATFLASIKDLNEDEKRAAKNARADEAEHKARAAEQLVKIEALKQVAARGKLEAVKEWARSFLETGEKLVVFAWHKEIVYALAEALSCDSITGETPIEKRQGYVDKFQNDPGVKTIVLNVQAGGVGLTLTAASNAAFVELGWNPAVHDQAEDRCHRIGQTDQVTAWYLLAQNTIDDKIHDLIESKREVVDAATEGGAAARQTSVVNDLIAKLMRQ